MLQRRNALAEVYSAASFRPTAFFPASIPDSSLGGSGAAVAGWLLGEMEGRLNVIK